MHNPLLIGLLIGLLACSPVCVPCYQYYTEPIDLTTNFEEE
jgi:hypothetical protein